MMLSDSLSSPNYNNKITNITAEAPIRASADNTLLTDA